MGRWKPILPFGESTIIQTVVANALAACERVILVTGYRSEEMASLFRKWPRVLLVENPDWQSGMFSSIQRAAREVRTPYFFVALGDMPWVKPSIFEALLACPAADVVFPVFQGRRGHPVLFSDGARREVLRADPATKDMKTLASRMQAGELPVEDEAILRDIDTAEDYAVEKSFEPPRDYGARAGGK